MLIKPRNVETAANKIERRQLARSGVSPGVILDRNSFLWLLTFNLANFKVDLKGNILYQRVLIAHLGGFKLTAGAYVISINDDYYFKSHSTIIKVNFTITCYLL